MRLVTIVRLSVGGVRLPFLRYLGIGRGCVSVRETGETPGLVPSHSRRCIPVRSRFLLPAPLAAAEEVLKAGPADGEGSQPRERTIPEEGATPRK
jgi:hypothetical protein